MTAMRLTLDAFRKKHGIRPWDGHEGVVYRFVDLAKLEASLGADPETDFAVITDPAAIQRWTGLLADTAERCRKYHPQPCQHQKQTHAPDRTALVVQPVQ
jgi:hypothetical protein